MRKSCNEIRKIALRRTAEPMSMEFEYSTDNSKSVTSMEAKLKEVKPPYKIPYFRGGPQKNVTKSNPDGKVLKEMKARHMRVFIS